MLFSGIHGTITKIGDAKSQISVDWNHVYNAYWPQWNLLEINNKIPECLDIKQCTYV